MPGSYDTTVKVWNAKTGDLVQTLEMHCEIVKRKRLRLTWKGEPRGVFFFENLFFGGGGKFHFLFLEFQFFYFVTNTLNSDRLISDERNNLFWIHVLILLGNNILY